MDYFKESENLLASRKCLEASLRQQRILLNKAIEHSAPNGLSTQNYGSDFSSSAAVNDALDELLNISELSRQIRHTEDIIARIEAALAGLAKPERDILTLWYIDCAKLDDIADRLGYSPLSKASLYRLRNNAIYQFALIYFGAIALSANASYSSPCRYEKEGTGIKNG